METKTTEKKELNALKERVKELNCLYGLTDIIKDPNLSFDKAIEKILKLIPPAWQFPEITCARIILFGKEYKTNNFKKTKWSQAADITEEKKVIGKIEVNYLEKKPIADEGPFLTDERRLIDAIAHQIGKYAGEKEIKNRLDEAEKIISSSENGNGKTEKQDWEVIIDLLIRTDPRTLLRITRKMVYYLYRYENEKITNLLGSICPVDRNAAESQWCGINMPNPRQNLESLKYIQKQIFEMAKESLTPDEISRMFHDWLKQDKARPLLLSSQKTGISLGEITDELNRFFDKEDVETTLAPEDKISIRTALISRFFTDRIEYVNIAKEYITLLDFVSILNHVIGPLQGSGKLGGKTSGVAIAEKIIKEEMENDSVLKDIDFPKSWYITSDTIVNFVHYNDLDEAFHIKYLNPEQIRQEQPFLEQVFKNATFPHEIMEGFRRIIRNLEGKPIIVRSSSLLEDSFGASFSGKYKSLFVPNTGSEDERLYNLINAISEVYASTFGPDPIEYRRERGLLDFQEEMGILVQEVVGNKIGHYYLPSFAGVAFSRNEFRWSPRIRREDGMIRIVPGLGTRAVDRVGNDYPIIVSPNRPELRVNTLINEQIQYSPKYLDVINLKSGAIETVEAIEFFREYAEEFPNVSELISVHKDGRLVEPNILFDPKEADIIITFSKLFEKTTFLQKMKKIMKALEDHIGSPVDVEFASNGKTLYILQCRPQSQGVGRNRVPIPTDIPKKNMIFSANRYITTSQIENIEYIVYVEPEAYLSLKSREEMRKIAEVINQLNQELPKRRFILMGPGRWGSRGDIKLGVPVNYGDINNTTLLVEIARKKGEYTPELSFGTHFFQDLVEADIRYLPLYPDEQDTIFNEELFRIAPNHLSEVVPQYEKYTDVVKLIDVHDLIEGGTLSIIMDGDENKALSFLKAPDHWDWRLQKTYELGKKIDSKAYGVKALYLIGSTKSGKAGPASDIDLIVHFDGTEEQKERLLEWFDIQDKQFIEENKNRTGVNTSYLLDIHFVTDKDIKRNTSWATHITSPYLSAKKIPISHDH
jgi:pyruvate, water dikinase